MVAKFVSLLLFVVVIFVENKTLDWTKRINDLRSSREKKSTDRIEADSFSDAFKREEEEKGQKR